MRIQTWTPTFTPIEETSIAPIWIDLLELPSHCYYKDILMAMLSPIGKVLYLDKSTVKKTRNRMERCRNQFDLTKARPKHVWLGYEERI